MLSNLTFNQSTLNITYRQGTDAALQLTLKDSTNTGEIVWAMSHNEIMAIMYSIYRDAAEKRDSQ